jgi:hypothetical protein
MTKVYLFFIISLFVLVALFTVVMNALLDDPLGIPKPLSTLLISIICP